VEPDLAFPGPDFGRHRLMDLYREVRLLMQQRHVIDYRLMGLLRELDRREHVDGRPLHVAGWLARTFGLGFGAAREKVRTARALGGLPRIDAAFREGKLSYSKVRALTRAATAENEAALLDVACRQSTEVVEHMVRQIRQEARLEDVHELHRQRSLTYHWAQDGSLVVTARLTPDQGAIWLKAMQKAEAELPADENDAARQADALTEALATSLAGPEGPSSSGRVAPRYQVVVNVPAETFRPRIAQAAATTATEGAPPETAAQEAANPKVARPCKPATLENGPPLHPETVRRLTCDGALVSMLENDRGEVLNVGRRTRVIPPAIARALWARDGHCQYPGCSHTKYIDGHHIVHWADGGETRLDNLILLCGRHHRMVHELGWHIVRGEKSFEFRSS
jgi:hypothetical protein